ncbi:hypothetical protein MASR1M66_01580 [Aminivibrio sp.]
MPPSFFDPLRGKDRAILRRQMKGRRFDPSLVLGAARRCSFGLPSVLLCGPLRKGRPFPTTFWLACPHLMKLCGRQEAEGGVALLDRLLEKKPALWTAWNLLHARIRLSLLSPAERAFLSSRRPALWNSLRRGGAGGSIFAGGGNASTQAASGLPWAFIRERRSSGIADSSGMPAPIYTDASSCREDESAEKGS